MARVLAVLGLQGQGASASGLELLGLGARLARATSGTITALALGEGAGAQGERLLAHGADDVLWCADEALARWPGEAGLRALERAQQEVRPDLLLFSADSLGRDLAPRIAARLDAGLITEATELEFSEGRFVAARPVFGGKAIARMAATTELTVVTVRAGAGSALEPDASRAAGGSVRELDAAIAPGAAWPTVLRREIEASDGPRLEEAKTVVSGGRGVGGPEGFQTLQELADALKGAVGASRAAVDEGWVPAAWQVGQTGKAVAPDLYIAVGISGASQHMVGCSRAKTLVAINTDPDALIFETARIGVVGDYRELVPALARALRELA